MIFKKKVSVILTAISLFLSSMTFVMANSNKNTFDSSLSTKSYSNAFIVQKRKKKRTVQNRLIRGPRGGCYYVNRNGRKTYVSRNLCKR